MVLEAIPPNVPGHAIKVGYNDRLRLGAILISSPLIVRFRGRLILEDGSVVPYRQDLRVTADLTYQTVEIPIDSGWLTTVSATIEPGVGRYGMVFVTASLVRVETATTGPEILLISNYITSEQVRSWPDSPLNAPIETPGLAQTLSLANPAAGANLTETLGAGDRWYLHAVRLELVTGVAVATRRVRVRYNATLGTYFDMLCSTTQAASLTYTYHFGRYGGTEDLLGTDVRVPLPEYTLDGSAGDSFRIIVDNIQAADQIQNVRVNVNRFFNV